MYFVMSDIHGCYAEMMEALQYWDKKSEKLIVLGDLIDRGPDSLRVIQTLQMLQEMAPDRVIILKGNHDEYFTRWLLDTPIEDLGYYYMAGAHEQTIKSFYADHPEGLAKFKRDSRKQRGQHLLYLHKKELRFLASLPMMYETDRCIFVHAGINLKIDNWRDDTRCMNEIRDPFIYSSEIAPKRVFFGHTPTCLIRDNRDDHSIWISPTADKIGIDGACSMGGQLNAIRINEYGSITDRIAIPARAKVMAN